MDGCEEPIEQLIKERLSNTEKEFNYLEIGVAECKTLLAVTQIILENKFNKNFTVIGLDLPTCGYVMDNLTNISKKFQEIADFSILFDNSNVQPDTVSLILNKNPREEIIPKLNCDLDFVFIDGCHGRNCVVSDFLAIEKKVKQNGIVLFHDVGLEEQGTDWQDHCKENINVRQAVIDLGLWDETRVGWKILKYINGTRTTGGYGNSCAAFVKD